MKLGRCLDAEQSQSGSETGQEEGERRQLFKAQR